MPSRICITGGPRTGKTERANASGGLVGPIRHTDDVILFGWHEASVEVSTWFEEPGPWIVEGVCVPRALRKWLDRHPEGRPCDVVLVLETPHVELTEMQRRMGKGVATTLRAIARELAGRGVHLTREK